MKYQTHTENPSNAQHYEYATNTEFYHAAVQLKTKLDAESQG